MAEHPRAGLLVVMAFKTKPKATLFPELFEAIRRSGMSDAAILRASGVASTFLSRLKRGKCGGASSMDARAKILRFLKKQGVATPDDNQVEVEDPVAAPPPGRPASVPKRLQLLIDRADTNDSIAEALKMIASLVSVGDMDRFTGQFLEGILKTRGVVLGRQQEDKERVDSDKPVKVNVVFETDFLGAPACPACHGTGRQQ